MDMPMLNAAVKNEALQALNLAVKLFRDVPSIEARRALESAMSSYHESYCLPDDGYIADLDIEHRVGVTMVKVTKLDDQRSIVE